MAAARRVQSQKTRRGLLALFQQARSIDIVAFTRAHSPYYLELYRDVPEIVLVAGVLGRARGKAGERREVTTRNRSRSGATLWISDEHHLVFKVSTELSEAMIGNHRRGTISAIPLSRAAGLVMVPGTGVANTASAWRMYHWR